ncbi:MAG TPA: AAA family ATPase [Devosiaceae bacterium]|nr:AAA family ATPase [Devosiaceae bacterium]
MKFSRLKLHGFKSFSDQTELHLEPGLSGVVGPNGCGKSNLVEALRWVMGESSYKAMRAAGMDDVIFSGSANRPSRNTAEVTLVLDNADRTAPAVLNNADVLEVTRRIEREAGSVYRVNGREVRARDVQLLFADASTGAHSPALVRQGQIGELIAAKPTARRALLEEAAGISGLHSRRHEAELRLKGAEQNLARVDDVIAQVESQLETLKRQARLAVRYRSLSGEIRKAEATLFHLRWVAARVAEKEAEAIQGRLITALADAQHAALKADKQAEDAEASLAAPRDREARFGAALQRLTILAEQMAEENKRAEARRAELIQRQTQLAADTKREQALATESGEALSAMAAEKTRLEAEAANDQQAFEAARQAANDATALVRQAETEMQAANEALAQLRARRAQAQRNATDAAARVTRLAQQVAEVVREAEALNQTLDADEALAAKREALEAAQEVAEAAEQAAIIAEEATRRTEEELEKARPALQVIDSGLGRLETEAATLSRILSKGGASKWPAIVDSLKVTPGYETALGAALGDDLDASADAGAPIRWLGPFDGAADPLLPEGVVPLSRFVAGSDLLKRRLDQIGLVEAADGNRLAPTLKAGQALVTKAGDTWRWDGLFSTADAPSAAAERLAQKNRLAELDAEIQEKRRERASFKLALDEAAIALETARRIERERRDAWRNAQRAISTAQAEVDRAQKAIGELVSRRSAVEEARTRLNASLAEAEVGKAEAEKALAEAGDDAAAAATLSQRQNALTTAREKAEQGRLRLNTFETAARMRAGRLTQIAQEMANWQRRQESAAAQLKTLAERAAEITAQLASFEAAPEQLAARREALEEQIEAARADHKAAADALAAAQNQHRETDRAARAAAEGLSKAREELARVEERIKGLIAQRMQIERQVVESLGIEADHTAAEAGIRPQDALPAERPTEDKLDRLRSERERLGGVNLGAEREAEEVREKLDTMTKDRDDLIAAIAKLRAGIQSLNREGRIRLSEAFEKVNGYFQELFTSLFGGGTAELQFVESDDPLEAGLEIIARPPGKKPTTMTLLSGGEQALTAMSLIFAVFLTNPAPICVLDEVDAPLDDHNVERFCNLLDSMRQRTETRFMVITHNPITMSRMDRLFGVTMQERGVSQLVSVDLVTAESFREAV